MTGRRNEDSCLFSLAHLKTLGGADGRAAPGHASDEDSGLIDIRAMAAQALAGERATLREPPVTSPAVVPPTVTAVLLAPPARRAGRGPAALVGVVAVAVVVLLGASAALSRLRHPTPVVVASAGGVPIVDPRAPTVTPLPPASPPTPSAPATTFAAPRSSASVSAPSTTLATPPPAPPAPARQRRTGASSRHPVARAALPSVSPSASKSASTAAAPVPPAVDAAPRPVALPVDKSSRTRPPEDELGELMERASTEGRRGR